MSNDILYGQIKLNLWEYDLFLKRLRKVVHGFGIFSISWENCALIALGMGLKLKLVWYMKKNVLNCMYSWLVPG